MSGSRRKRGQGDQEERRGCRRSWRGPAKEEGRCDGKRCASWFEMLGLRREIEL